MTEEEKMAMFKEMMAKMSNEDLAKHLLNKSLQNLAVLLEEDMATAADMNVIRAILKDNNIGIVPTRTNAAGKLKEKLAERSQTSLQTPGVIPIHELDEVDLSDFVGRVQ
ncbi:putative DNA maturase A [Aeromonas phage ZPAH7B]|uniref:Putative DNA maturase A n=2 Tax=Aerosvirus ZPAH7 TaxID=2733366 RepID=A0A3Q9GEV8_9CAUD|nr:terminase small subunit [Aeromonas phage ZPAH7]AZQ96386.1 putative DNA maturase A [Aeromonas phage ZPAH7]QAX95966.1 putative DNA maturase A [Aeromonas phage ZPAH7B]